MFVYEHLRIEGERFAFSLLSQCFRLARYPCRIIGFSEGGFPATFLHLFDEGVPSANAQRERRLTVVIVSALRALFYHKLVLLVLMLIATALLGHFLPNGRLLELMVAMGGVGIETHRFNFAVLLVFAGIQQLLQCE